MTSTRVCQISYSSSPFRFPTQVCIIGTSVILGLWEVLYLQQLSSLDTASGSSANTHLLHNYLELKHLPQEVEDLGSRSPSVLKIQTSLTSQQGVLTIVQNSPCEDSLYPSSWSWLIGNRLQQERRLHEKWRGNMRSWFCSRVMRTLNLAGKRGMAWPFSSCLLFFLNQWTSNLKLSWEPGLILYLLLFQMSMGWINASQSILQNGKHMAVSFQKQSKEWLWESD